MVEETGADESMTMTMSTSAPCLNGYANLVFLCVPILPARRTKFRVALLLLRGLERAVLGNDCLPACLRACMHVRARREKSCFCTFFDNMA